MEIPAHLRIVQAALGAPGLISRSTYSIIALANIATDLHQATPALHFDNAPDREMICARWRDGVDRPFRRIVAWCAPGRQGRLRSRFRALWGFGRLTHT